MDVNEEKRRLPQPGDWVGPYRILHLLAKGGYSRVYKAECQGRYYAVKWR
jgi:hypothetical protein